MSATDFQPTNTSATKLLSPEAHRFCIAPMIDWSDRHCRFIWRLISKNARLYTEMVTTGALIHGDRDRFLTFSPEEHPLALQLGGSDPQALALCARMAEDWGYDEINLNCGCPSDRVQEGKMGAVLMAEPGLVAECVAAMTSACSLPVTVKHRIGIDHHDSYEFMTDFVDTVASSGCSTFIVHARKAWLKGLSPKQNREIPPLRYDDITRLKKDRPQLNVVINGGITTIAQAKTLLESLDGVMIGREAYNNPWFLSTVDEALFGGSRNQQQRVDILMQYIEYCRSEMAKGNRLHHMSRHILGLFAGQKGARLFRRHITENANKSGADVNVLIDALAFTQ